MALGNANNSSMVQEVGTGGCTDMSTGASGRECVDERIRQEGGR